MSVYEYMRRVFPPIEQASAFTFAGRISAHGSILTLPTGWRTDILSEPAEREARSINNRRCALEIRCMPIKPIECQTQLNFSHI